MANKFRWPGGPSNGNSGFTLLETLIAITVMLIAFAAILSVQSGSINSSLRARTITVVAMLLRNQMVHAEYEIQGKTFDEVKKEDSGSFQPPFEEYRWTRVIKEIEFPNMNMNSATPPGGTGGGKSASDQQGSSDMIDLITKLVTQFLSKALREMTVTIYYKKGGKELSYSASTYWVDLNHEFQLSQ